MTCHTVYGITLESDFAFTWPLMPGVAPPDVVFACTDRAPNLGGWQPDTAQAVADDDTPNIRDRVGDGLDGGRVRGATDHYVWPDRIVCHLSDASLAYLVEIQLLGAVLALWLERRGVITLHASAIDVGGGAVALMGAKGGGKTTLATALIAAGHRLLADDLLAVEQAQDVPQARPGYPMLRLWPDQADRFVGDHTVLPLVHPAYDKRRVTVGEGFGRFQASAVPLRRIYLLRRQAAGAVEIRPIRPADALVSLVGQSFLHDAVHGLGLAGSRLALLADLLAAVEVRALRIPSAFDRLDEVVAAIEDDARSS